MNENINIYIFNEIKEKKNLIFCDKLDSKLTEYKRIYTKEDELPLKTFGFPESIILYDFINNPDYIIIIKNNKIHDIKYFLNVCEIKKDMIVVDTIGNTLKITSGADLIKIKTEYNLYREILKEQLLEHKKNILKTDKFFDKWYSV